MVITMIILQRADMMLSSWPLAAAEYLLLVKISTFLKCAVHTCTVGSAEGTPIN